MIPSCNLSLQSKSLLGKIHMFLHQDCVEHQSEPGYGENLNMVWWEPPWCGKNHHDVMRIGTWYGENRNMVWLESEHDVVRITTLSGDGFLGAKTK